MAGILCRNSLQIGIVLDAMHHVAKEPKEGRERQSQTNPHEGPRGSFFYTYDMGFAVDNQHVEHQDGNDECNKANEKNIFD